MAIPDYQTVMLPLLRFLRDGKEHNIGEVVESLAAQFDLSADERQQLLGNLLAASQGEPRRTLVQISLVANAVTTAFVAALIFAPPTGVGEFVAALLIVPVTAVVLPRHRSTEGPPS